MQINDSFFWTTFKEDYFVHICHQLSQTFEHAFMNTSGDPWFLCETSQRLSKTNANGSKGQKSYVKWLLRNLSKSQIECVCNAGYHIVVIIKHSTLRNGEDAVNYMYMYVIIQSDIIVNWLQSVCVYNIIIM